MNEEPKTYYELICDLWKKVNEQDNEIKKLKNVLFIYEISILVWAIIHIILLMKI